jgi:iduronate 2-sulfatase
MKFTLLLIFLMTATSLWAQGEMNVLLICVDDLRPELASFGAEYIHSPNIDRLAREGRAFNRHYVNAPSCGPSRFTLLTGRYGAPDNNALFQRADELRANPEGVPPSMPEWFRGNGYTTVSVGKVSHHPGGLGGADWNNKKMVEMPGAWDESLLPVAGWQHPRGVMHGLANGEVRSKERGTMDVLQSAEGPDNIYPDGHITEEALSWLDRLGESDQPFFFAVGLIRPHLPFGAPKQYLDLYDRVEIPEVRNGEKPEGVSTWHASSEFMQYNLWGKDPREDKEFALRVRKHYAACVSYADAQVGKILARLKSTGQAENTIVILWGDHGWNLGEHGIWGKHNLYETALRSPLIIKLPKMRRAGKSTQAIVETTDIFPTICELANLPKPDFTVGNSLAKIIKKPGRKGHAAYAYLPSAKTIRTDRYRFTAHNNGRYELYDHGRDPGEVNNISSKRPGLVAEMHRLLSEKLSVHDKLR